MATMVPSSGNTAPTRNQMKNELPLSLPITPADRPQKNARTTNSTGSAQHAEGPDHGHDRHDRDDNPEHCDERADHSLEQQEPREGEDRNGHKLATGIRSGFSHTSKSRERGLAASARLGRVRADPLQQSRGTCGEIAIEPGERHRAHHPAGPMNAEPQSAQ